MSTETATLLIGAMVSIATALFGWLQIRDQRKFTSIDEQIKTYKEEIDKIKAARELDHKTHLLCVEKAARLEERVKMLEEIGQFSKPD